MTRSTTRRRSRSIAPTSRRRCVATATDSVEVSLRRARLGAVRGDLPAAVVPHHARGVVDARTPRARHPPAAAAAGERSPSSGCGSGEKIALLIGAAAEPFPAHSADRHFAGGARDGAVPPPGDRRARRDDASRAVRTGSDARRRSSVRTTRSLVVLVPRIEHRQLHAGGRARSACAHPPVAAPGRRAAARHRSRQARTRAAPRLRRSAEGHRGVQPQPASPDQRRARRQFRSRRIQRIAQHGTPPPGASKSTS